jgi:ABC-type protease/lipase transport system fused ATPase/permease subunit
MESDMRVFFGMILGCLITVGAVYIHDMRATSTVASSTTGIETRQLVNWDVAQANWNKMAENARHAWIKLRENVRGATT